MHDLYAVFVIQQGNIVEHVSQKISTCSYARVEG